VQELAFTLANGLAFSPPRGSGSSTW